MHENRVRHFYPLLVTVLAAANVITTISTGTLFNGATLLLIVLAVIIALDTP